MDCTRGAPVSRTSRPASGCPPTPSGSGCGLAVVSLALIQAYRDEALTLDHLTAFTVTED